MYGNKKPVWQNGMNNNSNPWGQAVSTFDQNGREIGRTLVGRNSVGEPYAVDISNQIGLPTYQSNMHKYR